MSEILLDLKYRLSKNQAHNRMFMSNIAKRNWPEIKPSESPLKYSNSFDRPLKRIIELKEYKYDSRCFNDVMRNEFILNQICLLAIDKLLAI